MIYLIDDFLKKRYYWRWKVCLRCGHIEGIRFEESYGIRYADLWPCKNCNASLIYNLRATGEDIPIIEESEE